MLRLVCALSSRGIALVSDTDLISYCRPTPVIGQIVSAYSSHIEKLSTCYVVLVIHKPIFQATHRQFHQVGRYVLCVSYLCRKEVIAKHYYVSLKAIVATRIRRLKDLCLTLGISNEFFRQAGLVTLLPNKSRNIYIIIFLIYVIIAYLFTLRCTQKKKS